MQHKVTKSRDSLKAGKRKKHTADIEHSMKGDC